ncbi:MAG: NUDIX domain-containing protein [Xanthobacteraceae bacterium]
MTPSSAPDVEVAALDDAEISLETWQWPFAAARRGEIDRHFAHLQRERAGVWNGRILLLHRYAVRDRKLHGACFKTDYASLCAWRDWQFPDRSVSNFFVAAALRAADGAYLVGEMASDTAAAALLYFPCGTPEPDDINAGGVFDPAANLRRELLEETGLEVADLASEPGWTLVRDRGYVALLKRLTAPENADALRARIMRHIASEQRPELVDIRILRGPEDFNGRMPPFVTLFLEAAWRR